MGSCCSTWAVRHSAALLTSAETVPKAVTASCTTVAQLGRVGDVVPYVEPLLAELLRDRPALVLPYVGDDDPCPGFRAHPGLGRALAACGAGDDDDFPVQCDHGTPLLVSNRHTSSSHTPGAEGP